VLVGNTFIILKGMLASVSVNLEN